MLALIQYAKRFIVVNFPVANGERNMKSGRKIAPEKAELSMSCSKNDSVPAFSQTKADSLSIHKRKWQNKIVD